MGSLPAISCSGGMKDQQVSSRSTGIETGNTRLVDPSMNGSYFRELKWSGITPAINEGRRQERFEEIRGSTGKTGKKNWASTVSGHPLTDFTGSKI
jgi:hypothetical protein